MNKLMSQINEQLEAFKSNADAYAEKGNKAAGARARKASLNSLVSSKEALRARAPAALLPFSA